MSLSARAQRHVEALDQPLETPAGDPIVWIQITDDECVQLRLGSVPERIREQCCGLADEYFAHQLRRNADKPTRKAK